MKSLFTIILSLAIFTGFAQKQIDNQFNSWWNYAGNHKISDKFSVHTLYSFRRNDFVKNWQQSLLRVGLNYHYKKMTFTGGYDWVVTFPYGNQPIAETTTEQRIFQQLILKNQVGRIYFKHRYKMEQRFIGLSDNQKFRNRFRYRIVVTIPINHKTMEPKTLFVSAFDELFVNFGKGTNGWYFNQNWESIGLGYKIDKKTAVTIGYMLQYLPKTDNIRVERNHTLLVGLSYSLSRNKEKTVK